LLHAVVLVDDNVAHNHLVPRQLLYNGKASTPAMIQLANLQHLAQAFPRQLLSTKGGIAREESDS
jgi:hypothetical protein